MFWNEIILLVVGILWGATNPLIRRGSIGVEKIQQSTAFRQIYEEFKFLATRWQYLIPFILNQSGSILYFFALQSIDLTIAVPVTNALSFVFTSICSVILGEQPASLKTYAGMVCVFIGITICVYDKNIR